jgi:exonuclease III
MMSSLVVRVYVFLSWNVWGLNEPKKRMDVKNFIMSQKSYVLYLQETKLSVINDKLYKEIMGSSLDSMATVLAEGLA